MKTFTTAGAAAVAANTVLYAAGRAAGADFVVTSGAHSTTVPLAQIVVMSFVPVVLGGFVLRAARRRVRVVEAVAVVATALSLGGPLTMAADAATGVALAAMHIDVGAVFLVAAEKARGRRFTLDRRSRHSQMAAA